MPILQLPSRRGHVPSGGTTGQIVTKLSNDQWDYNWADPAAAGGGAPTNATYLITTANATLTNAANLGLLTTGLLKITVAAGVATPATAIAGTDYLSGNQTITLSGDVTGSGTTAIASTIANNAVTYAKMQDVSATSRFLGRITAGAGDPEELTAANAKTILALTSSDVGLGNVTNDAQTKAAIVPNTVPTDGKILVGSTVGGNYSVVSLSNDATLNNSGALTIANNAVTTVKVNNSAITLAKIQNAGANSVLLGSGAAGIGAAYSEIALGTNLSMSGTTLNATGGGGTPGGANTQVQFNDSGAFGGDAGLTYDKVNNVLTTTDGQFVATATASSAGTASAPAVAIRGNTVLTNGLIGCDTAGGGIGFVAGGTEGARFAAGHFWLGPSTLVLWGGSLGSNDIAITRNAAGVLEINNSTAGVFRDLKCDHVNAVTGYRINGAAPSGYDLVGNGTDFISYPADLYSSSTAAVSAGYASDTYLAGSTVTVNAGDWKAKGQYHCVFDMTKTGAGTATPIITLRMGTLGTTGDAAICTFTLAAGTAVADTGIFEVWATFRTVGAGTSAVVQGVIECRHLLAATGLTSTGAAGVAIILNTSSGFNSTTQTKIGLSFNGGTSFSGTNTFVQAALTQP